MAGHALERISMTPLRKRQIITGVLTTTAIARALSGFFALLTAGFTAEWPGLWLSRFLMGWPVGFAVSAIVAGQVQRLAAQLTRQGGTSHS